MNIENLRCEYLRINFSQEELTNYITPYITDTGSVIDDTELYQIYIEGKYNCCDEIYTDLRGQATLSIANQSGLNLRRRFFNLKFKDLIDYTITSNTHVKNNIFIHSMQYKNIVTGDIKTFTRPIVANYSLLWGAILDEFNSDYSFFNNTISSDFFSTDYLLDDTVFAWFLKPPLDLDYIPYKILYTETNNSFSTKKEILLDFISNKIQQTSSAYSIDNSKTTFTNLTNNYYLIQPGFFNLSKFKDGVYEISFYFKNRVDNTLTKITKCIFVDCEIKCLIDKYNQDIINTKVQDNLWLLHYGLSQSSNCDCECTKLCDIYKNLHKKLKINVDTKEETIEKLVNPSDCGCN